MVKEMAKVYRNLINERIERYGVNVLSDEETLSFMTGISLPILKENLEAYGLVEIIKYSSAMSLTKTQAKKLELLFSLVKRISTADYKNKTVLNSSAKAGEYFVKELQFHENEVFAIAMLDSQNRLIKTEIVSHGTINEAAVYPRSVVKAVLANNANSIIMAHNHPGGSRKASAADIDLTNKIAKALITINVSVVDHVIVAENQYISLAEQGLINPI